MINISTTYKVCAGSSSLSSWSANQFPHSSKVCIIMFTNEYSRQILRQYRSTIIECISANTRPRLFLTNQNVLCTMSPVPWNSWSFGLPDWLHSQPILERYFTKPPTIGCFDLEDSVWFKQVQQQHHKVNNCRLRAKPDRGKTGVKYKLGLYIYIQVLTHHHILSETTLKNYNECIP